MKHLAVECECPVYTELSNTPISFIENDGTCLWCGEKGFPYCEKHDAP